MVHQAKRIPGILYYLAAKNKLDFETREHMLHKWECLNKIVEAHKVEAHKRGSVNYDPLPRW